MGGSVQLIRVANNKIVIWVSNCLKSLRKTPQKRLLKKDSSSIKNSKNISWWVVIKANMVNKLKKLFQMISSCIWELFPQRNEIFSLSAFTFHSKKLFYYISKFIRVYVYWLISQMSFICWKRSPKLIWMSLQSNCTLPIKLNCSVYFNIKTLYFYST